MENLDVATRPVLITGCSTGIGQATAVRLVRAGFTVWASARQVGALEALRAAGCHVLALDVTDESSMRTAVDRIEDEVGALYALVNNAGYSQSGALETLPIEQVRRQLDTNVVGPLRLTQLVVPAMRRAGGGRIVNISSMGGRLAFPGGGAYHASKFALEALSDVLRFELAPSGIDVVVIEPGTIRTEFAAAVARHMPGRTPGAPATTPDPYAAYNAAVNEATKGAYERGLLARLGGEADDVARVIEASLRASRPRTRYRVTPSAHLLIGLRRLLSDRLWDALMRSQNPAMAGALPSRVAPRSEP
jgi:NAD(P)-dependent dehydrogenase (short-subunit alcohol dehydrogenase family)